MISASVARRRTLKTRENKKISYDEVYGLIEEDVKNAINNAIEAGDFSVVIDFGQYCDRNTEAVHGFIGRLTILGYAAMEIDSSLRYRVAWVPDLL